MGLKRYVYGGPLSHLRFKDAGGVREVPLFPRGVVELPEDDPRVRELALRGLLDPVAEVGPTPEAARPEAEERPEGGARTSGKRRAQGANEGA